MVYLSELFGMMVNLSSVWRSCLSFLQTISGTGSPSATQSKTTICPLSTVKLWGSILKVGGTIDHKHIYSKRSENRTLLINIWKQLPSESYSLNNNHLNLFVHLCLFICMYTSGVARNPKWGWEHFDIIWWTRKVLASKQMRLCSILMTGPSPNRGAGPLGPPWLRQWHMHIHNHLV